MVSGWGKVENRLGTWGMDKRSILFLNFDNPDFNLNKESILEIYVKPLPHPELVQGIEVNINGNNIGKINLTNKSNFYKYFLKLNSGAFKNGINIIEFKYDYSFTPLELGLGSDSRKLAVLFKSMLIRNMN